MAAAIETTRPGETMTTSKATDHPAPSQEEQQVVSIIFEGSSVPSCRCSIKLHNRDVNSVFSHPVDPLRWSEIPITFD